MDIHTDCQALAQTSRPSFSTSFRSLSEICFRQKVVAFFLPPACNAAPMILPHRNDATGLPHSGQEQASIGEIPRIMSNVASSAELAATPDPLSHEALGRADSTDKMSEVGGASAGEKEIQENDDLMKAIQLSKSTMVPLSNDGTVLLRLTCMARTPEVLKVLLTSPVLEECRKRVTDAGCEVAPSGACRPKFFVPCTNQQLEELAQEGFELMDHNILALSSDRALIEKALGALSRPKRPRLSPREQPRLSPGVDEVNNYHGDQHLSEQDEETLACSSTSGMGYTRDHALSSGVQDLFLYSKQKRISSSGS